MAFLKMKPFGWIIVLFLAIIGLTSSPLSFWSQSSPQPKGTTSAAKVPALPSLWKSASTGKEYRVKVEGDRFTAEWTNIPPAAAKQGAYIRSECRHTGSRWIGTSRILLPCPLPDGKTKMCPMVLRFEVDFISPDRITGGGEILRDFDCSSCEVRKTGWGPFSWATKTGAK